MREAIIFNCLLLMVVILAVIAYSVTELCLKYRKYKKFYKEQQQ